MRHTVRSIPFQVYVRLTPLKSDMHYTYFPLLLVVAAKLFCVSDLYSLHVNYMKRLAIGNYMHFCAKAPNWITLF